MDLYNIFWFLVAAIAAALPIPMIKQYTETNNNKWIILSIVSYLILVLAYTIILANNDITIIYPLLKVLSILIVVIAGLIFFSNQLDTQSILGIIFGIISIYLLSNKISKQTN